MLMGTHGGATEGARKLMDGAWRNGTWAEAAVLPLENLFPLNEDVLCGKLGYSVHDLAYLSKLAVPCGGLMDSLEVKAGDRVVIAPATGAFSGAAVVLARAMGADVIMVGRNKEKLEGMQKQILQTSKGDGSVDVVAMNGDAGKDAEAIKAIGVVDKYLDLSPPAAKGSTHIASCLMALKRTGIACFMGGINGGVELPYLVIMFNDLVIKGKFMYSRDATKRLIRLVESGKVTLGEKGGVVTKQVFGLNDWEGAIDLAEQETGWGRQVCFGPATGT